MIIFSNHKSTTYSNYCDAVGLCYLDGDYLYLDTPHASVFDETLEDESYEIQTNNILQHLDKKHRIFSTVTKLFFSADFMFKLPNLHDFTNLQEVVVSGSRMWDLSIAQLPKTVKLFDVRGSSNVRYDVLFSGETSIECYHSESDFTGAVVPFFPSIKKLVFYYVGDELSDDIFESIKNYTAKTITVVPLDCHQLVTVEV